MGILDKLNAVADTRKTLFPAGIDPLNVVIDEKLVKRNAKIGFTA